VRIGIGHPGIKEMVSPHVLSDFTKSDREWLEPLLDAIADNADLLVKRDNNGFMNRLSLAVPGAVRPKPKEPGGQSTEDRPQPKAQSHIRQARPQAPVVKIPETGPMAAMLKRLFGSKD
jgi:PTH1 family peptidyl-tRNA hydrolase